jgi:hypothetical protein
MDDESWVPGFLKLLLEDLEPLALPAEAQIRFLADNHLPMEELRLLLSDEMDAVPQAVKVGAISTGTAAVVEALHAHMYAMSIEFFLSYAALDEPEWQRVRELAAEALEQMSATKPPEQREAS